MADQAIHHSVLTGISTDLPVLSRAQEMLQRGASVGWKYPNVAEALKKVDEELKEAKDAAASGDNAHLAEELGDLLHATTAVAMTAGIDATQAMETTNNKWVRRFEAIEHAARNQGVATVDLPFKEKLKAWNAAKSLPVDGQSL